MVFLKADFEKIGGFDPEFIRTQDYELLVRWAVAGTKVRIIREPLVFYRLHLASETVESYSDQFLTAEYVRAKYLSGSTETLQDWVTSKSSDSGLRKKIRAGLLLRSGIILFHSGNKVSGLWKIIVSALFDPRRTLEKFKRQATTNFSSRKK
jgi:GT2 family glycosyltransferase